MVSWAGFPRLVQMSAFHWPRLRAIISSLVEGTNPTGPSIRFIRIIRKARLDLLCMYTIKLRVQLSGGSSSETTLIWSLRVRGNIRVTFRVAVC